MNYPQISKPTLLLDTYRCKANIRKMIQKAVNNGFVLRPHFKTHQSHVIGQWFREEGIDKITVSSVGMATFFAMNGWDDITIAFPVNLRQIEEIKELSQKIKAGLVIVDPETVDTLGYEVTETVNVWIKIDVGTHRTGIRPEDTHIIDLILDKIKAYPQLSFVGFLGHAGHTYQSHSIEQVERVHQNSIEVMNNLRRKYTGTFPGLKISLGDTPAASMVSDFGVMDEFRPGNFVFYDLQQEEIGSCTRDEIAVSMACPVVAVHPDRLQWIIYGGGIHFAKDFLTLKDGRKCFGRWAKPNGNTWSTSHAIDDPFILSLSQEHGVVQCTEQSFDLCKPGDISLWLPVHSCMTAEAMGGYLSTEGEKIDHYREHLWP